MRSLFVELIGEGREARMSGWEREMVEVVVAMGSQQTQLRV